MKMDTNNSGVSYVVNPGGATNAESAITTFVDFGMDSFVNAEQILNDTEENNYSEPTNFVDENLFSFFQSNHIVDGENIPVSEDPTANYMFDPSYDPFSFKSLEQSLEDLSGYLQEGRDLNSSDEETFIEECSSEAKSFFKKLLFTTKNDEGKFSCEDGIFLPNSPFDIFSEEELVGNIKEIFEYEGKLKDSAEKSEILSRLRNSDTKVFQDYFSGKNADCYDWDKFLEKWEEAQPHELKTGERQPPASSTSTGTKRKFPFNKLDKRKRFAGCSSDKSVIHESLKSSTEEHNSNEEFVFPSLASEREMIVYPIINATTCNPKTPGTSGATITSD